VNLDTSLNIELRHLLSEARTGNPCASAQLVETASMPLLRMMRRRYHSVPDDMMRGAIAGAVLHVVMHPQPNNETHYSPVDYLLRIANRKLQHKLDAEKKSFTPIPLEPGANRKVRNSNLPKNHDELPSVRCKSESLSINSLPAHLKAVATNLFPRKQDQALLDLIMSNDFSTEKAAAILDVAHLPLIEQQAIVRRHRNRILGRLRKGRPQTRENANGN
jgi:hypothetical protein